MGDIWNQNIQLTEEDKQYLGITDAKIAEIEAKKALKNNRLSDYLQIGEQLTTSALNGLSQGFYDEYEGGATALGYGLANLGMQAGHTLGFNVQAPTEDVWSAMKRGYINGRDYRRQVLEDARREMPWLSTGMEAVGAVGSPVNKVLGPISTGTLSGYGNSNTNGLGEISMNMGIGAAGNKLGDKIVNQVLGKGGAPIFRNASKNILGQSLQNGTLYLTNSED